MRTKEAHGSKKQPVTVKDLQTKKDSKGGFSATIAWGDGSTTSGVLAVRAKPIGSL